MDRGELEQGPSVPGLATITLTEEEAAAVEAASARLVTINPLEDPEAFVMAAHVAESELPPRVRRTLLFFRRFGHASGGLLIRNLPIGVVPSTPRSPAEPILADLQAARVMAVLAAVLGEQFGYRQELAGWILQNVLPTPEDMMEQTSTSSGVLLKLHIEQAFSELRPDIVALLCVRQDPGATAGTLLATARAAVEHLDDGVVEALREARFETKVDKSFRKDAGSDEPVWIGPIAVLSGDHETLELRCDMAETRGLDDLAQWALDQLHLALSKVAVEVRLEPGDLLLTDNHVAAHGRTPFRAFGDGNDRWLLRTFLTFDLHRSLGARSGNGRVIFEDFGKEPPAAVCGPPAALSPAPGPDPTNRPRAPGQNGVLFSHCMPS